MPARAVSYGISKTDASLLVSVICVTNLISMPLAGLLADIEPIKQYRFYLYSFWVEMAAATTLWSFGLSLEAQMAYAILYGIAQGLYINPNPLICICSTLFEMCAMLVNHYKIPIGIELYPIEE